MGPWGSSAGSPPNLGMQLTSWGCSIRSMKVQTRVWCRRRRRRGWRILGRSRRVHRSCRSLGRCDRQGGLLLGRLRQLRHTWERVHRSCGDLVPQGILLRGRVRHVRQTWGRVHRCCGGLAPHGGRLRRLGRCRLRRLRQTRRRARWGLLGAPAVRRRTLSLQPALLAAGAGSAVPVQLRCVPQGCHGQCMIIIGRTYMFAGRTRLQQATSRMSCGWLRRQAVISTSLTFFTRTRGGLRKWCSARAAVGGMQPRGQIGV